MHIIINECVQIAKVKIKTIQATFVTVVQIISLFAGNRDEQFQHPPTAVSSFFFRQ